MGKGSRRRPEATPGAIDANWDRTFGRKKICMSGRPIRPHQFTLDWLHLDDLSLCRCAEMLGDEQ